MRKLLLTLLLFISMNINPFISNIYAVSFNIKHKVMVSTSVYVLVFTAKWCGACRAMMPELDAYIKHHPEVYITKKDLDDESAKKHADYLGVNGVPTTILFKGLKLKARHSGFMTEAEIDKFVKENS